MAKQLTIRGRLDYVAERQARLSEERGTGVNATVAEMHDPGAVTVRRWHV